MPLEVAVMLFMKLPQIPVRELRSTPRLCVLLAHVRATESLRGDIVNEAVVAVALRASADGGDERNALV